MADAERITAYIVAGGASRRMDGRPKGFLELGGKTILARVIEALRPQASQVFINSNLPPSLFADYGAEVLADFYPGEGPLGGLLTCLSHAAVFDPAPGMILTVPWDCPFLPSDLAARLASGNANAAIAESGGRAHFLTGLWHPKLLADLRHAFETENLRKMSDWAARVNAVHVKFVSEPLNPFFNVNSAQDLARANELARQFGL